MDITSFYRVQLNKNFNFSDLEKIIPYLKSLGISHIYLSPILQSTSGSMHGYDTVDYSRINAEIGGEEDLKRISGILRSYSMGIMVDFVPNHMAINNENVYLQDIFKNGKKSIYYKLFDILDLSTMPESKIILPVLDDEYYPSLAKSFHLDLKKHLLYINGEPYNLLNGSPDSRNNMDDSVYSLNKIINSQIFYPGYWKMYISGTNYRRFFAVGSLIGIHSERKEFFKLMFQKIIELADKKIIDAVRIDHIDGLYSPLAFIKDANEALNLPVYVEKILTGNEKMPFTPYLNGTTGYDFLYYANYLFINNKNVKSIVNIYELFTGMHYGLCTILCVNINPLLIMK